VALLFYVSLRAWVVRRGMLLLTTGPRAQSLRHLRRVLEITRVLEIWGCVSFKRVALCLELWGCVGFKTRRVSFTSDVRRREIRDVTDCASGKVAIIRACNPRILPIKGELNGQLCLLKNN